MKTLVIISIITISYLTIGFAIWFILAVLLRLGKLSNNISIVCDLLTIVTMWGFILPFIIIGELIYHLDDLVNHTVEAIEDGREDKNE